MPKAKTGNFTLRTLADKLSADEATPRFLALQRSGQYSELRILQKGKQFRIVGYKWPDKSVRRKLNIGRARINPTPEHGPTSNQVYFQFRNKRLVGWINREMQTRYEITYKVGDQTRTLFRPKNAVMFVKTGKRGKVNPTGQCSKRKNPDPALEKALIRSEEFHGLPPRHVKHTDITFPKALVLIGDCAQIDYISDKFDGKLRRYFHEFDHDCQVFTGEKPQPDGSNLLIIKGRFKIKPEGIIG